MIVTESNPNKTNSHLSMKLVSCLWEALINCWSTSGPGAEQRSTKVLLFWESLGTVWLRTGSHLNCVICENRPSSGLLETLCYFILKTSLWIRHNLRFTNEGKWSSKRLNDLSVAPWWAGVTNPGFPPGSVQPQRARWASRKRPSEEGAARLPARAPATAGRAVRAWAVQGYLTYNSQVWFKKNRVLLKLWGIMTNCTGIFSCVLEKLSLFITKFSDHILTTQIRLLENDKESSAAHTFEVEGTSLKQQKEETTSKLDSKWNFS